MHILILSYKFQLILSYQFLFPDYKMYLSVSNNKLKLSTTPFDFKIKTKNNKIHIKFKKNYLLEQRENLILAKVPDNFEIVKSVDTFLQRNKKKIFKKGKKILQNTKKLMGKSENFLQNGKFEVQKKLELNEENKSDFVYLKKGNKYLIYKNMQFKMKKTKNPTKILLKNEVLEDSVCSDEQLLSLISKVMNPWTEENIFLSQDLVNSIVCKVDLDENFFKDVIDQFNGIERYEDYKRK